MQHFYSPFPPLSSVKSCRHRRKPLCRRQNRSQRPSFVTAAATTFYEVLQVSKDADTKTIKKAFKKMALKYHPDVNNEVRLAIWEKWQFKAPLSHILGAQGTTSRVKRRFLPWAVGVLPILRSCRCKRPVPPAHHLLCEIMAIIC